MGEFLVSSRFLVPVLTVMLLVVIAGGAISEHAPPSQFLFENVVIFDSESNTFQKNMHVLVSGGNISEISTEPLMVIQSTTMQKIFGRGLILVPGHPGGVPGTLVEGGAATFFLTELTSSGLFPELQPDNPNVRLILENGTVNKNTL